MVFRPEPITRGLDRHGARAPRDDGEAIQTENRCSRDGTRPLGREAVIEYIDQRSENFLSASIMCSVPYLECQGEQPRL